MAPTLARMLASAGRKDKPGARDGLRPIADSAPAPDRHFVRCLREGFGAEGRTRTGTGFPTRPSNVRVYQFRHFGIEIILLRAVRSLRAQRDRRPGQFCGAGGGVAGGVGSGVAGVVGVVDAGALCSTPITVVPRLLAWK